MSQTGRSAALTAATLLVVDDSETGLYFKTHTLLHAGFRVLQARTGKEALRVVAEDHPTVVVLDIKLPDIDGIAVCRAIKEDPTTADTLVLQVSAYYTRTEDFVTGLESGADAYIPGDIAPALLVAAIRALLRTGRAEQALRHSEQRLQLLEALDRSREQLRTLAGSLLTAQDEERRRIARELHDDVGQRLGVLQIELTNLRQRRTDLGGELDMMIAQTSALSERVRDLSHGLHPSVLDHLGLETGLRSLCEEFERTHGIPGRCICCTDDSRITVSTATAFYRIAQEALRNVAKHAGDARVTISLAESNHEIRLTIQDDGCGFDSGFNVHKAGLGLISMEERIRLVGGHLDVHSAPGEGTTVNACAPVMEHC
jgi:signal transduction histidine kinase